MIETLRYPDNVENTTSNSTFLALYAVEPFSYFDIQGEKDGGAVGGGAKIASDTWRKYRDLNTYSDNFIFDVTKTDVAIHMYMPNLLVNTQHEYNDTTVSWVENVLDIKKAASKGYEIGGDGLVGIVGAGVEGATAAMKSIGATALSLLDSATGNAVAQGTGFVSNPKATTLYKGTSLRQQNFNFQLKPTSVTEIKTVHNIIRQLRGYSSASITGSLVGKESSSLKVPHFWFLEELISQTSSVSPKRELFKFGPAVLTAIRTNYTPDTYWSMFKSGDPVYIDLELQFTELIALTREDIIGKDNNNSIAKLKRVKGL